MAQQLGFECWTTTPSCVGRTMLAFSSQNPKGNEALQDLSSSAQRFLRLLQQRRRRLGVVGKVGGKHPTATIVPNEPVGSRLGQGKLLLEGQSGKTKDRRCRIEAPKGSRRGMDGIECGEERKAWQIRGGDMSKGEKVEKKKGSGKTVWDTLGKSP